MRDSDRDQFAKLWRGAWALHAKPVTVEMLAISFSALADFELRDIERALTAHIRDPQTGQFPPKPSDVIGRLTPRAENDGRPGVEEAWALIPKAERESAVITDEMATAFGAAQELIDAGDLIAARMAFKEVYQHEMVTSRAAGRPVHWFASLGHDVAARETALRKAVDLGRLTRQRAVALLPSFDVSQPDPAGRARLAHVRAQVVARLESPAKEGTDEIQENAA
jgi:hypothetical protein